MEFTSGTETYSSVTPEVLTSTPFTERPTETTPSEWDGAWHITVVPVLLTGVTSTLSTTHKGVVSEDDGTTFSVTMPPFLEMTEGMTLLMMGSLK
jgi:hypothetical protein